VAAGIFLAAPAHAQVAGSVDIESDYRLRGYSLSGGQPTAAARISYDDDSGVYLNALAIGEWGRDHARFLGVQGNIGYAKRLTETLTIDSGVLRADYRPSYPGARSRGYTEAYVGLSKGALSGRISVSPDYFNAGVTTVYGELQGTIEPMRNWRLTAHVGSLSYLTSPVANRNRSTRYDWRLGVARQFRALELHAALSGGGPGREFYSNYYRDRAVSVTAGISWSF
jgi:uncharacterized protein (TIGR02001 family)